VTPVHCCYHMLKTNQKIGILGSSFNPPHLGHLAVIEDLIKRDIFDQIWLIPVYYHAFTKNLAPFEERLALVDLLIRELPQNKVQVLSTEKDLGNKPSYTIDVVTTLKLEYPDCQFWLIVGSDIQKDLDKWHRIDDLKKIIQFHFIPRKGYEKSPYPEISSSEIRARLKKGLPIDHLTTPEIVSYLKQKRVYDEGKA